MAEKKTQNDAPAEVKATPMWEGTTSAKEPLVGPDGHVHLSEEDLKARVKADA
jgi:hypothetical protein